MDGWIPDEGGESADSLPPIQEVKQYPKKFQPRSIDRGVDAVDEEPKQYKNNKPFPQKQYKKKVYKKVVLRDYEAEPVTEDEFRQQFERGERIAVWHLAQRDQTVKQIKDKLKKKNIAPNVIEAVIEKLLEKNYLNDSRYAENFTRSRSEGRKMGKNAIKFEMMRKGVDADTASEAISEIQPEEERERGVELIRSKLYSTRNLEKDKRTARLLGLLARKGYSSSVAYSIIKEVLSEEIIDDDFNT